MISANLNASIMMIADKASDLTRGSIAGWGQCRRPATCRRTLSMSV
jgi:hypothetical protein